MRRFWLSLICCFALVLASLGSTMAAIGEICPMASMIADDMPCCPDGHPGKLPLPGGLLCKTGIGCTSVPALPAGPLVSPQRAVLRHAEPVAVAGLTGGAPPNGPWRPPRI